VVLFGGSFAGLRTARPTRRRRRCAHR